MPLIIRNVGTAARLDEHLALDALAAHLTPTLLAQTVAACQVQEKRVRKLPATVVLAFCIAMNLFASDALGAVFRRFVHGLRGVWPETAPVRVTKGALSLARYRLGARPLVALFHQVCRPLGTPQTPGAYAFGYRHLALDTQTMDLPDTLANDRAFGRPSTNPGVAAWPQARLVGLVECGTHAYLDAGLWPYRADQHAGARRLLRSVGRGDLLSYDCGFHRYSLLPATPARGAHVLARLPAGARPTPLRVLTDGTVLARIDPTTGPRRAVRGILVRLIRYTLDDPALPHHGEEHRLITTLLNPLRAPAEEVVFAYHNRWEYELSADEIATHQRPRTPLRSHKPVGVVQEVYGLLIAHYLVRVVMVQAAQTVDLPPTRLSFLETLRILRDYLPDFQRTEPAEHPRLHRAVIEEILAVKLPPRAPRINPGGVKQKMVPFPVKRASHRNWPEPTKPFRNAIVLLN